MFVYAGSAGTPKEKGSVTGNGEGIYTLYWDGKQDLRVIDTAYAKNAGIICMSMDHRYLMIGLCDQSAVQIYELNEKNGIPEKKVCETSVPSPASFVFA